MSAESFEVNLQQILAAMMSSNNDIRKQAELAYNVQLEANCTLISECILKVSNPNPHTFYIFQYCMYLNVYLYFFCYFHAYRPFLIPLLT